MAENPTFDARRLWASQGTPYIEPDIVVPAVSTTAVVRTLVFAAQWRAWGTLSAGAVARMRALIGALQASSALSATATILPPA